MRSRSLCNSLYTSAPLKQRKLSLSSCLFCTSINVNVGHQCGVWLVGRITFNARSTASRSRQSRNRCCRTSKSPTFTRTSRSSIVGSIRGHDGRRERDGRSALWTKPGSRIAERRGDRNEQFDTIGHWWESESRTSGAAQESQADPQSKVDALDNDDRGSHYSNDHSEDDDNNKSCDYYYDGYHSVSSGELRRQVMQIDG